MTDSFDALAHERYKLVKSASDRCRRAGARLQALRKKLRVAELDMDKANRELRLAIDAVQPPLDVKIEAPDELALDGPVGERPLPPPTTPDELSEGQIAWNPPAYETRSGERTPPRLGS